MAAFACCRGPSSLVFAFAGLPPHMGPAGGFGRGFMPHDYNQPFRNRLATGSYYMDPEEIDSILRIQWKSLHTRLPLCGRLLLLGEHGQHACNCLC